MDQERPWDGPDEKKKADVRGANTRLLFRHIGKIQIRHWVPTCSRVGLKGCLCEIGLGLSDVSEGGQSERDAYVAQETQSVGDGGGGVGQRSPTTHAPCYHSPAGVPPLSKEQPRPWTPSHVGSSAPLRMATRSWYPPDSSASFTSTPRISSAGRTPSRCCGSHGTVKVIADGGMRVAHDAWGSLHNASGLRSYGSHAEGGTYLAAMVSPGLLPYNACQPSHPTLTITSSDGRCVPRPHKCKRAHVSLRPL